MSRKGKGLQTDAESEKKPTEEAPEEVENEVSEEPEVDETPEVEPEAEAVEEEADNDKSIDEEVAEEAAFPVCDACKKAGHQEDLHPVLVGKLTFNVCDDCAPKEEKSTEIELSPEPAGPEKGMAVKADPKVHARPPKKMFRIIIDFQENSDKNGIVKCTDGQNTQYTIKRNHEVDVPEGVVNVLKESVTTQQTKDADGNDVFQDMPRYALRVLKEL